MLMETIVVMITASFVVFKSIWNAVISNHILYFYIEIVFLYFCIGII